jgi:hypothetical protein
VFCVYSCISYFYSEGHKACSCLFSQFDITTNCYLKSSSALIAQACRSLNFIGNKFIPKLYALLSFVHSNDVLAG